MECGYCKCNACMPSGILDITSSAKSPAEQYKNVWHQIGGKLVKIRESYGSRRYEEEYRAALEKSVHYFRQNSCITELRKMGYAQTKLQVEYEAEEYGKSEICCLDAETNTF